MNNKDFHFETLIKSKDINHSNLLSDCFTDISSKLFSHINFDFIRTYSAVIGDDDCSKFIRSQYENSVYRSTHWSSQIPGHTQIWVSYVDSWSPVFIGTREMQRGHINKLKEGEIINYTIVGEYMTLAGSDIDPEEDKRITEIIEKAVKQWNYKGAKK